MWLSKIVHKTILTVALTLSAPQSLALELKRSDKGTTNSVIVWDDGFSFIIVNAKHQCSGKNSDQYFVARGNKNSTVFFAGILVSIENQYEVSVNFFCESKKEKSSNKAVVENLYIRKTTNSAPLIGP